jgi:hypothetical protein
VFDAPSPQQLWLAEAWNLASSGQERKNTMSQSVHLAEIACPHCNLFTRADYKRCLHCGKPLEVKEQPTSRVNPAADPGTTGASSRHDNEPN